MKKPVAGRNLKLVFLAVFFEQLQFTNFELNVSILQQNILRNEDLIISTILMLKLARFLKVGRFQFRILLNPHFPSMIGYYHSLMFHNLE
ncbi:hypothetical protein QUF82_21550 [Thiotrichales bacterium HSG14]|nr:hypothetical protein [Thiotrichales bacterium HSG14]